MTQTELMTQNEIMTQNELMMQICKKGMTMP